MFENFQFFKHKNVVEPGPQTTNTGEGVEGLNTENQAELSYEASDYEMATNQIELDPEFFIQKVEEEIDATPINTEDPLEYSFSEGSDDIIPFDSNVETSQKPKTGTVARILKQGVSVASAFAVLGMAACEKRSEVKFSVGGQAGDEGPAHRIKLLLGVETHVDKIGPDGNPIKYTPEAPKEESNEPKQKGGVTQKRPGEPEVDGEDAQASYPEPKKVEPKTEVQPTKPIEVRTVPVEVEKAPVKQEVVDSTTARHEGPGRKIAEYLEQIVPSKDLENGYLDLNDKTVEAISKGCLAYFHETHSFALALTKNVAKQGIPVDALTYYQLQKGNKPRPPMNAYFSDYAKKDVGSNRVDFRSFDMARFDRDLRASVSKDNFVNAKGVFNEKSYAKAVEDTLDNGHQVLQALLTWIKSKPENREALYREHTAPYIGRRGTTTGR